MDETPATKVATLLEQAIPDTLVLEHLANELHQRAGHESAASILVDGTAVVVPMGVTLTIVDKILFREAHGSTFPTGCRVDVALGDTGEDSLGLLHPAYGFARLFFDPECRCTQIEFRSTNYRLSDDE